MTTFVNDNGSVRVPAGFTATTAWLGTSGWGDAHVAIVSDPLNPTGSGHAIEKRYYGPESSVVAAGATTTYIPCQSLKYTSLPGAYMFRNVTINGQTVLITSYDGVGLTLASALSASPLAGDAINIWGQGMDSDAREGIIQVWHWSTINPAFFPAKTLYVRLRVWLSPNWPGPTSPYNESGFKFFYLATSGSNTNVIWTSKEQSGAVQWDSLLNAATIARAGNVAPGVWHTVEYVFQMNSAPGVSDGAAQMYLDGSILSNKSGILWVGATSTNWNVDFDGVEFNMLRGGVGNYFSQDDEFRIGEIYISGR